MARPAVSSATAIAVVQHIIRVEHQKSVVIIQTFAAVNLAGGVGSRLKVKYGATVSVSPSDKVMIKSTRQAPQYTYAHVIGQ